MNNENEIVEDLKNWKELIKPYATPEIKLARKEVWKTVLPFGLLFIAAAIVYEFQFWGALGICFLAGLFLTRIFIIQHDCGHQSFFPDRTKNDRTGFLMSLMTFGYGISAFANAHQHHICIS